MVDPVPFEITRNGDAQIATNGAATLTLLGEGRMFKKRAVRGLSMKPCAETAIPMLDQLAGELLASLDMPAHIVAQRLADISASVQPVPTQRVEWAVVEVDGVWVHTDGVNVIVSKQEMTP